MSRARHECVAPVYLRSCDRACFLDSLPPSLSPRVFSFLSLNVFVLENGGRERSRGKERERSRGRERESEKVLKRVTICDGFSRARSTKFGTNTPLILSLLMKSERSYHSALLDLQMIV